MPIVHRESVRRDRVGKSADRNRRSTHSLRRRRMVRWAQAGRGYSPSRGLLPPPRFRNDSRWVNIVEQP